MKIVLATGIFYPDVGGPAIHVRKIAEALVQDGFQPVVVSYGDYSGPEEFPFKVVRISIASVLCTENASIEALPIFFILL